MLTDTSLNIVDDRGRSLLHWAVACKRKEVVDFLIQKGIDVSSVDHQGKTPLHVAVQFGNEEFFDHLLQMGPPEDWQSLYGNALLTSAVLNKSAVLVEKLIAQGVDVNGANERGSTALEVSERIGATEISTLLISNGADEKLVRVFRMQGDYMGQEKPGTRPKIFAPNFISTEEQEFGSVFNAAATEFFFAVDVNGKHEIRYSKLTNGMWTKPKVLLAHERYGYNDPFLSNDENRLYFISKRPLDGTGKPKDVDIWYVEKNANGWSEPHNAGRNINTPGNEYYISFTEAGTMYFSSNGHARKDSTRTDHDIYTAKFLNNHFQKPVLLGTAVNTEQYEADVFVAPDESYMIFCSTRDEGFGRGDLYVSFKEANGNWAPAINMGDGINTSNYEYCPFVTKDGKYLFYTSNQDIYWVSTEVIHKLKVTGR